MRKYNLADPVYINLQIYRSARNCIQLKLNGSSFFNFESINPPKNLQALLETPYNSTLINVFNVLKKRIFKMLSTRALK